MLLETLKNIAVQYGRLEEEYGMLETWNSWKLSAGTFPTAVWQKTKVAAAGLVNRKLLSIITVM